MAITGPPGCGAGSDVKQVCDASLEDERAMQQENAGEVDVLYNESGEDINI